MKKIRRHTGLCSMSRGLATRPRLVLLPALIACLALIPASRVIAQTFVNLHNFTGGGGGSLPECGLVLSGNTLYGTTEGGGSGGSGTVFAVNTNGTGFTVLHNFTANPLPIGTNSDGEGPQGTLVLSGNTLYGTAQFGGSSGNGTVFAVHTDGTGFATLHSFTVARTNSSGYDTNSDGLNPTAGLISSGTTLYGTTKYAGISGGGTVFALQTDGTGFTTLHNFTGASDGNLPYAGLTLSGTTLYGTAQFGGSGIGTVFAVNTNGTGFTTLYSFGSTSGDGALPEGGVIISGNTLYGTTSLGGILGTNGHGTVFAVHTDGTGFTTLYSFAAGSTDSSGLYSNSDGTSPEAALVLSGTTLYGTAYGGGTNGVGTVFAVNTDGTGFTTLYSFGSTSGDGAGPVGGVILSGTTLYGTTSLGGSQLYGGTVFALSTPDNTPPVMAITSPANGDTIQSLTSITGMAYDGGSGLQGNQIHFTLYNDGNFWSGTYWTNTSATDPSILLTASVFGGAWTFTSVPTSGAQVQGSYFISAFARDNAGNTSTPQSGVNNTSFTIDSTPPLVAITNPTDGAVITSSLPPISGTASDDNGVQSVYLYIIQLSDNAFWDGTAWAGGGSAILPISYDPTVHTWVSTGPLPIVGGSDPKTAMSNGNYDIIAIAYDAAGNQQRSDSIVSVNSHPVFTYTGKACCPPPPGTPGDPNDWFDSRNWSPSGVPGSSDVAIIDGFTVNFGTSVIVAELTLRSGSLSGGSLGFNPSDPGNGLVWQGGTLACNVAIQANGQLTISGSADKVLPGANIVNLGKATWLGTGNIVGYNSATITNLGVFDMQNDQTFTYCCGGGAATFANLPGSVLRKSIATGVTSFGSFLLLNDGVVDIQSGLLSLTAVNHSFASGSDLRGLGRIRVDGTTVNLNGNITLETGATFELASGTVTGTNTFVGPGTFVWSGGALVGSMNIASNANLSISGSADKSLPGGVLNNAGTSIWMGTGNLFGFDGAAISNSGLFELHNDAAMDYCCGGSAATFYNQAAGTLRKTLTTGTTTIGNFNFTNNGTVDLSSGVLSLAGGYTPSQTSQLKVALGGQAAGTQFSQLHLGGSAALAGTLSVSLANGFSPTNGSSFAIVDYGSLTSQFSAQQLPALPLGRTWNVEYGATALMLHVQPFQGLQNPGYGAGGSFGFDVTGPPATSAIVWALPGSLTTNSWKQIFTNTPFSGSVHFSDPESPQFKSRMYEVIFQQ